MQDPIVYLSLSIADVSLIALTHAVGFVHRAINVFRFIRIPYPPCLLMRLTM